MTTFIVTPGLPVHNPTATGTLTVNDPTSTATAVMQSANGVFIFGVAPDGHAAELDARNGSVADPSGAVLTLLNPSGHGMIVEVNDTVSASYFLGSRAGGAMIEANDSGAVRKVGFFGVGPVAKQATPVTLADVIALLQAYGLSA